MITFKLKPEVKAKWLAALRSGEYKQGIGSLQTCNSEGEKSFCCLGVLSDLFINETGEGEWVLPEHLKTSTRLSLAELHSGDSIQTALPSQKVNQWAFQSPKEELSQNHGVLYASREGRAFTNLNDKGVTFLEIADIIESDL